MKNQNEVFTFQFSESENQVRSILINEKPHFAGSDVAKTLGYKNVTDAIKRHCRYVVKHDIPHPQNPYKKIQMLFIPEADVFRLIIHSDLPSAEKFEQWVMEEVLPSLRKTGKYQMNASKREDYIDLRHQLFSFIEINNQKVRVISYDGEEWFCLVDRNKAIKTATEVSQQVKTLGETNAKKIWIYGSTNPSWFVTKKALQMLELGKRTTSTISPNQLSMFN